MTVTASGLQLPPFKHSSYFDHVRVQTPQGHFISIRCISVFCQNRQSFVFEKHSSPPGRCGDGPTPPEITDLLGIGYRRIPILAIGNDIYCNTSLIASALERRFPASEGYNPIFPAKQNGKADTGMIKAFSQYYADQNVFAPAVNVLPWERLPSGLIKDRSSLRDAQLNPTKLAALRPQAISTLSSHLTLVEEQLADGREWLFETVSPSLADVSLHFIFHWVRPMKTAQGLFESNNFPKALQWMDRLSKILKEKSQSVTHSKLSGDEAARLIASSPFDSYDSIGFDETEAKRLGLTSGCTVEVAPTDTGRTFPTRGKLVAINREELVVETTGKAGTFRVHFPRLEFFVRVASGGGDRNGSRL